MMSSELLSWWSFLCAAACVNVVAWLLSAAALHRRQGELGQELYAARRVQLLLSAGYVFGCAFRSALPVYDVPRQVMFDTWLSSVLVGRSVATVAELCFAAQWAWLLREASRATGSQVGRVTSTSIVPLIAVAEICSWYSVLTTSNLGHVLEESIWGLSAGLLVVSLVAIWPRCAPTLRPVLLAWCALGVAYVAFMFFVDVPMYWARWVADESVGRSYLTIGDGVIDASARWVVSHRWDDWKGEATWMSLYFSVAVWLSIALVHAPATHRHLVPAPSSRRGPATA